jgi:hypothetical protein
LRVFSSVGFPDRELPHGEAEKIKAHLSFIGMQCVGDSRFLGAQD